MTDFTNASTPPDNSRTVLCILVGGEKVRGWFAKWGNHWCHDGGFRTMSPAPAGWKELEDGDEQ